MTEPNEPTTILTLQRWPDGDRGDDRHDVRSLYAERCAAAVLGPSCLLLLRLAASLFEHSDTIRVDASDLAQQIGLNGRLRTLNHTLNRLRYFGMAEQTGEATWRVRTSVPELSERQLCRHGALVRGFHHLLTGRTCSR